MSTFNPTDCIIICLIGISALFGLLRGLVVELLSIAVWVSAVTCTFLFGYLASQWFPDSITMPSVRIILGHATVFFAILILGSILIYFIRRLIKSTGLSGTDRLLGVLFGLLRGSMVVLVLTFMLHLTPLPESLWWRTSHLLPWFEKTMYQLTPFIPEPIKSILNSIKTQAPTQVILPIEQTTPPYEKH